MNGVPDLSALLQGRLKLIKKGARTEDIGESHSTEPVPDVSLEEQVPEAALSEEQARKEKKKKTSKKRSREDSARVDEVGTEAAEEQAAPKPKKKKKKKVAEEVLQQSPSGGDLREVANPDFPVRSPPVEKDGPIGVSQSAPLLGRSGSENFIPKKPRIAFPDRVDFRYEGNTPLICDPLECAELMRQIKGAPAGLPRIEELVFKDAYINASCSRKQSDGAMNVLVEKYDSTLKQTLAQLGAVEEQSRNKDEVIRRLEAEKKEAAERAMEEKRILREKFDKLVEKLLASRTAKKALALENKALKRERDAASAESKKEMDRLRESRRYEVTLERVRVLTSMIAKAHARFERIREHGTCRDAFEKARNLYGQASGTRKCLEMIRDQGVEIPQEMVDMFAEQEKAFEQEVTRLDVGPIPEADLTLSPLVLPSRFLDEGVFSSIDPYGSNAGLIDGATLSRLLVPASLPTDSVSSPIPPDPIAKEVATNNVPSENATEECVDGSLGTDHGGTVPEGPVEVRDSSSEGESEEDESVVKTPPPLHLVNEEVAGTGEVAEEASGEVQAAGTGEIEEEAPSEGQVTGVHPRNTEDDA